MTDRARRLPPGRHGLTRDEVVRSQRGRIFLAMAEAMAERGYARTSVSDVLRRAGVSRETFYEQFSSKEDCFVSALEAAVGVIFEGMLREDPAADAAEPIERVARGMERYLDAIAGEPLYARLFLIESYAAGPEALRRRAALQRSYAEVIGSMLGVEEAGDRFAVEALVTGIVGLVTARLAEDDLEGVRALHAPVMQLIRRVADGLDRGDR